MAEGQKLPIKPETGGKASEGFCTPETDKKPQVMCVPPKRVLPIIFIPGIMGSNLRMSRKRQLEMGKKGNIAWRPDSKAAVGEVYGAEPNWRQRVLDPEETEVDSYDEGKALTGNPEESVMDRNSAVRIPMLYSWQLKTDPSLLLVSDPIGTRNPKSVEKKALERGWGEVFFGSYGNLLMTCEKHFNDPFDDQGVPSPWWQQEVLDVPPQQWGVATETPCKPLDKLILRSALGGCWFPVHAMGYNWLRSNGESGTIIADRARKLMESYRSKGYVCKKVILITHSMGGLVARAAMHPEIGGLQEDVLGVIHGVMPAIGAAAAYKRIRCGFEGNIVVREILGLNGREVTAVLGNAQGGMELLPTEAYGNGWLQARYQKDILLSLPKKGDPYDEIYKIQGKWFQLLNPQWINPAGLRGSGIARSLNLLDQSKDFHSKIHGFYHPNSYAHYGADPKKTAWKNVIWEFNSRILRADISAYQIIFDSATGKLRLGAGNAVSIDRGFSLLGGGANPNTVSVSLLPAVEPGDQTVPLHSADDQLLSRQFKGIFRQQGYEHQGSYKDANAVASTCYSLVRIIQEMQWGEG
ncbi:MAG: hypothetical protein K2X55_25400 [Burkholderiaceae bacterium]|nr:hypothetical protein [Burkholderiaceae bacterium]